MWRFHFDVWGQVSTFVVVSGCSGGGKSTLLAELSRRGYATVAEPGRRIVADQLATGGTALPWTDPEAFARCACSVASADLAGTDRTGDWVFFDRGLVDAVTALRHAVADIAPSITTDVLSYHRRVFLTPPWAEIYAADAERRHGFDDAVAEHERLTLAYGSLGYETIVLPKVGVEERADFVVNSLVRPPGS